GTLRLWAGTEASPPTTSPESGGGRWGVACSSPSPEGGGGQGVRTGARGTGLRTWRWCPGPGGGDGCRESAGGEVYWEAGSGDGCPESERGDGIPGVRLGAWRVKSHPQPLYQPPEFLGRLEHVGRGRRHFLGRGTLLLGGRGDLLGAASVRRRAAGHLL